MSLASQQESHHHHHRSFEVTTNRAGQQQTTRSSVLRTPSYYDLPSFFPCLIKVHASRLTAMTTTDTAYSPPPSPNNNDNHNIKLHPLQLTPSWNTEPTLSSSAGAEPLGVARHPHRHTTPPDLGELGPEEQAALETEITARRAARRASTRRPPPRSYADIDDDDDDDRVLVGTRVAEGHRNYQLM